MAARNSGFNKNDIGVKFRRPPRTKIEAIRTLQQADDRYTANQKYLLGKGKRVINENVKQEKEDKASRYLENVPKGISFARLFYPPSNSEIIVCGVKRRAMLHSSFVTDLLTEMQPECTFV